MKKVFGTITALALTASLLVGCGGASGNSTGSTAPAQGAAESTAAAEPQAAAPAAVAAEDGLVRTAVLYDISTMDVAETSDNYLIPMNVFDRLFETRNVNGTAEVVKSLCEDYTVSEDGLTYDFTIKSGVVFSNGSELTASDVKYTFERLLRINHENTDIAREVVGGEALANGEADSLEGISVKDDTHLTVTLEKPNAGFLAELSSAAMGIVDAETMEKVSGFGKVPADTIGSGPYIVTEWVANDHYTLVYNDKYWGAEPSVKKLIVSIVPDANTQNLMFQNGELDLIDLQNLDSAIVQSSYAEAYKDQIVSTPKVGMTYLVLNNAHEYLKDVNVRKAIGMAINVDVLIDNLYSGNAVRENGIIPTGCWGHNDSLEGMKYDPAAAKELLAKSGYTDGQITFELALDSSANSTIQLVYESIRQSLNEIGIKAEVKSYDQSVWLDLRKSGEMDSFVARWGMDYNDPANIMATFFGGESQTKSRSINYPDTETMARVAAASSIVDDAERMTEYQNLEKKLIGEDAAWIPLYTELHQYCIGSRVASFTPQWAGFSDFYASDVVLK